MANNHVVYPICLSALFKMASTHAEYARLRLKQYSKYRDMMGNRFSSQLRAVKKKESKKCHNSTF